MAARASVNLSGFVVRVAQKQKNIYVRHKLDTEIDKYYQTLHKVVIPEFMDLVKEMPIYPQRIKECLTHTTPSYFDGWNYSIELMYRAVTEEHQLTEKNIEKSRILRALMDISYAMAGIIDDYADKGEYRHGKKVWASICEGGQEAAVYDSIAINYLSTLILKRHFRDEPGYSRLLELYAMVGGTAAIGNTLDILDRYNTNYKDDIWKYTVQHKAMKSISAASAVGLAYGGVICDNLLNKTLEVFEYCGLLFQVWDDFMEYYSVKEQSGKLTSDSKYNIKSWSTLTAMSHFNEKQAKEFKDCYGSNDPAKRARVRELYDEVDLPGKYVDYLKGIHTAMENKISQIPDSRIRNACTSYIEWLLVEPPHDAELAKIKAF